MAEPAASTLVACLPLTVPVTPFFSFCCFSCFSISVALPRKVAGKASRTPAITGPLVLRHETGDSGDDAAEKKTQRVLAPLRVPEAQNHPLLQAFSFQLYNPEAEGEYKPYQPAVP
jgi:hypothetical protein